MSTENSKTYAVIDNGLVENFIIADSLDLAEEISGKQCVEVPLEVSSTREMSIGMVWNGQHFVARKPADSWIWEDSIGNWIPPIPRPSDHETIVDGEFIHYIWLESEQRWISNKEAASAS